MILLQRVHNIYHGDHSGHTGIALFNPIYSD